MRRTRRFPQTSIQRNQMNPMIQKILLTGRDQLEQNPFSRSVWNWWANEFSKIKFLPQSARAQCVSRHLIEAEDVAEVKRIKKNNQKSLIPKNGNVIISDNIVTIKKTPQNKEKLEELKLNKEEGENKKKINEKIEKENQQLQKQVQIYEIRFEELKKQLDEKNKELEKTRDEWFKNFQEISKKVVKISEKKEKVINEKHHSNEKELEHQLETKNKEIERITKILEDNSLEKDKIIQSSNLVLKSIQELLSLEAELVILKGQFKDSKDPKILDLILKNFEECLIIVKRLHSHAIQIWGENKFELNKNIERWVNERNQLLKEMESLKNENENLKKTTHVSKTIADFIKAKY